MDKPSADARPAKPARPVKVWAALVLACAALVVGGLLAWRMIARSDSPRRGAEAPVVAGELLRQSPDVPASGPEGDGVNAAMALAGRAMAGAGLSETTDDPLGLAPPRGAQMRWGNRRTSEAGLDETAEYSFAGTQADAQEYYRTQLAAMGFRVVALADQPARAGRQMFIKGQIVAMVSLLKDTRDANIVTIRLTATQPRR